MMMDLTAGAVLLLTVAVLSRPFDLQDSGSQGKQTAIGLSPQILAAFLLR